MKTPLDPLMERVRQELEINDATERAIKLGKEIARMMDKEKAVTKCLIAGVLYKECTKRFPIVFEQFKKLGI